MSSETSSSENQVLRSRLDHFLTKWSLDRDGDAIETQTSLIQPVRRSNERAILKLLKPISDEAGGAALLRYYDGQGAVRLLESESGALLMEGATGPRSLRAMATPGEDEQANAILVDVIVTLHGPRTVPIPSGLMPLSERFSSLFDQERDRVLLGQCAAVARKLLASSAGPVPLHGDLHHGNVLDGGGRGWLAIDPKALLGERAYDVANLLRNPAPCATLVLSRDRMARLAVFYSERLELDRQRILDFAFAHAGLSAAWDIEDGLDPSYSLQCAELLSTLVAVP